ncbi:PKD domain-containing protein [Bacteroidota bacterium]
MIFIFPNPETMSNLRVSCHKILMYLFILTIILACSNDIDMLTDAVLNDTVTITVNAPVNKPPTAIAIASPLSGETPLTVNFNGSNSSDDSGVTNYYWDILGTSSSNANTTHTFNDPGVYDITLTVTDVEGLTDNTILTINVSHGSGGSDACTTQGGQAGDSGFKSWCWEDITIPDYSDKKGVSVSNNELYIDSECYEKQVTNYGNQLKFQINPTNPTPESWCSQDFNMRAEIRTSPWRVDNPLGTEEWFGWSYTFGNDYIIDQNGQWKFFQVYPGPSGLSPNISLEVIHGSQFNNHNAGEIYIVRNGGDKDYRPTGITPVAGEKLDIVVHVIWGNSSNGLLQVWINNTNVYNEQVSTTHPETPWGGNAKWGIYKWPWKNAENVQKSLDQGITKLTTYLGPIRMITRKPGDVNYGKNSFLEVAPR